MKDAKQFEFEFHEASASEEASRVQKIVLANYNSKLLLL